MAHPNYTTKFAAGLLVFLQCHKNNYCVQMAQTLGGGVLYLAQFSLPTIEFCSLVIHNRYSRYIIGSVLCCSMNDRFL
jgi:hypothetical protein